MPTSAARPTETPSDEATKEGLRLAREAGEAYLKMVDYFIRNVATSGTRQRAGDFEIGFACEEAEPLYHLINGRLDLIEPFEGANAHLEVVVLDAGDYRFVPELLVHVTLTDANGREVGTWHLPFLWHPTMYHYGRNVRIPADGEYDVRVAVETPRFPRHDKVNGRRYDKPTAIEFKRIRFEGGRK